MLLFQKYPKIYGTTTAIARESVNERENDGDQDDAKVTVNQATSAEASSMALGTGLGALTNILA